jgi:Lrp/AsnC family leucine-responsive transcriptional regulator
LKRLTDDSTVAATSIAQDLKIAVDTVLQRIKRFEQEHLIARFLPVLNNRKINQLHYKVLISLSDHSPERIKQLLQFCRSFNRIIYIIKSLGNWNYELDIEVEDVDQFREIMMTITKEFPDIIRDYDSLLIRNIFKYNYLPYKTKPI